MTRANHEVEALLYEYTDLLAILSEDRFKPRAFEKAARAVGGYPEDIRDFDVKQLMAVPSVGRSIADKIHEYLQTGKIDDLNGLRDRIPAGVREMMSVPGLGPKKAMALYEELSISSVDELQSAIEAGSLTGLKGFGAKTGENILRGIETMRSSGGRVLLGEAYNLAQQLLADLTGLKQVERATYAGSLRRMCETIGDIDLLVASSDPHPIMEFFSSLDLSERVLASGETKTSIVTNKGMQVDLRVVPPDVWGAALQYFTGSKGHNVRVREMAVRKGLKLSEYGLFEAKTGKLIVSRTEEEVYERLGLEWIPPTMREDRGEVEAALEGSLPKVLEQKQVKGDLHTHTNLTDGLATIEQMIAAAADVSSGRKFAYYAITDHAPDLAMQRMTDAKMLSQRKKIDALQAKNPKLTLLHGSELNIDPEGKVDWGPEFLSRLDVTVASVHGQFNQTKEQMTKRIITAMENPYVNIIGHPTGRLIGRREPIEFDYEEVFKAAARTGTAMEINCHPDRIDLRDDHILWARRHGVKFAVDTDAHSIPDMDNLRFGIATAQRGWLGADEVINTWPIAKLQKFLRKGR